MKKIRELEGEELAVWQDDYGRRQQLRENIGREIIAQFKTAAELPEDKRRSAIARLAQKAREQGYIAAVIDDIMIEEAIRAAFAKRDERGANMDFLVSEVDSKKITPDLIKDWGNAFRIHPKVRESYLRQIREGDRKMLIALDKDGEPAGRISLIFNGPIPPVESTDELDENDVIEQLGGRRPWVEDLSIMEGYRSTGLGIRLMLEIEESVRRSENLPNKIALAVKPDNARALRMYEGLGYEYSQILGSQTFISHLEAVPPHEALLMIKQL